MYKGTTASIVLIALASTVVSVNAAVLNGLTDDAQVSYQSPPNPQDGGGTVRNVGSGNFDGARDGDDTYNNTVYVFQLPSLGALAAPFTDASFTMTIANTNSLDAFNGGLNYDLYGLGARASASVLGSDFFIGGFDSSDATRIQDNFIDSGNTNRFSGNVSKTTDNSGSLTLASYLNAQYAAGANAGEYVFLRINLDGENGNLGGINNYAADTGTSSFRPSITYTAAEVPEPTSMALGLLGLTFVGRRRRNV